MNNTYLSFITDEDLYECIEFLYNQYENALKGIDFDKFFKNRIDTFKMTFDTQINNLSEEAWLANELQRQVEKTITNHIGTFHEKLIGKIDGYTNHSVGNKYDVSKDDGTLFAEIKNKHNTVTGTHVINLFNKIKSYADQNPNAICYYVRIIDKVSQNKIWKFTSGDADANTKERPVYSHNRIRIVSGDEFYKIVAGYEDAYKDLSIAIPKALEQWMQKKHARQGSSMGLFAELYTQAKQNNHSLYEEIVVINYKKSNYLGFN
ncbi:Eco47II family restriction endonuclease [Macrococcoides canis]|uniref:Eco47II family restriction endonuclease n=1 Tax=Macrococcoides canis TaxID=1855823 RepID=UPI0013E94C28|nr:Eco47II family restriction endonuclease [Macrococcus canis]QIH76419.1 Eco47II family restriction endonuclease [Macrococcus canis]